MKIGIFSDLHLNWYGYKSTLDLIHSLNKQANEAGVDLLINAGDTADAYAQGGFDISSYFDIEVLTTFGNHDCWRVGFNDHFDVVERHGKRIVLTPLWTNCHDDPLVERWFKTNMDGDMIPDFTIAKMKFAFAEAKRKIFELQPDIVVTHNPPSMLSVSEKYAGQDMANKSFIPELGNEIAYSSIKLWVCGHVHHRHEYVIGDTKVVCNPLGYPGEIYNNVMDYKLWIEEI